MSCPGFVYTPHGREGIGILQPQSGIDYPLVAPSADIQALIADFHLAYDDVGIYDSEVPTSVHPLRVSFLYNIGCVEPSDDIDPAWPVPANTADIIIVDSYGTEVLNTTTTPTTLRIASWGDDYLLYEWTTDSAVCRMLVYTTWKLGEPEPRDYPQYFFPESAVLSPRAVHKLPKRLRTISVRQRNSETVLGPYAGNIQFHAGYNMLLATSATTLVSARPTTTITASANVGAGAGTFPVCGEGYDEEEEPVGQPIRQINGVGVSGNDCLLISAKDCIYVRQPTTGDAGSVTPINALEIGADCAACCSCDKYVELAQYMHSIGDAYKLIGERVTDIKDIHEDNIAKWRAKRDCTLTNPLKLVMRGQCCPYIDIIIMLCNPCQECLRESVVHLVLTALYVPPVLPIDHPDYPLPYPEALVVCHSPTMYYSDGTASEISLDPVYAVNGLGQMRSSFAINFPAINHGSSVQLKFRVRMRSKATYTVLGTVSGELLDGSGHLMTGCIGESESTDFIRTVAVSTSSALVTCNSDGDDIRPC